MKKIIVLLLPAVAAVVVMSSCKETLPKRFDLFVSQVEKRYTNFSEDNWKKANAQFDKLLKEYQENRDSYNAEEKKQIPSLLDNIGGFFKGLGGEN